jgi:AAA domain
MSKRNYVCCSCRACQSVLVTRDQSSVVRNNPERNVGAAGTLQDLNVAISRSKEKLIILGNFDMMLNGWTTASSLNHRKSPARNLARLVDMKYGKITDAPKILTM